MNGWNLGNTSVGKRQFPVDIDAAIGTQNAIFRTRNLQGVFTAVQAGIGIGPVYRYLGDREPNLARVLLDEPEIEKEVWLTTLPEFNDNVRVRAVYDYLASAFIDQRSQLSGSMAGIRTYPRG